MPACGQRQPARQVARSSRADFDDLEDDDVGQWVHRVKRLSELGLEEEASELEQSLIELTRNDPELQQDFLKTLTKETGRLVADPGAQ
jgi:hypothetical protein